MFRIEVFCDDKNLPRILHSLMGLVHGHPNIQPVANAKVEKGEVRVKVNGNLVELFTQYIKDKNLTFVTPSDIKAFCVQNGYAAGTYSNFLRKLLHIKFLRKETGAKGKKMSYAVLVK